jgi:hypothetical protein
MDFSGILEGLSAATATAAVIGAAAIMALIGFAIYGGRRVAGFFGK